MSTFAQRTLTCSACRQPSAMSVAVSLNGGRQPELRLAILGDTFQRIICPSCGVPGRIEQPFVYLDFTRKHWITCFHRRREASWATLEGEPHEDWKEAMITFAPRIVREMSASFRIRAVFGVDALREKLLCFEHGIDDVWLPGRMMGAGHRQQEGEQQHRSTVSGEPRFRVKRLTDRAARSQYI